MRRWGKGLVSFACVLAGLSSLMPANAGAAPSPQTAVVYGDSLTYESVTKIIDQFAKKPGWTQHWHAFPGFALCDFLAWLPDDLAAYHPSVVTVEAAGNYTRPCMLDANGNQIDPASPAFLAKYRADMNSFFATATASGAAVVWIAAPPMLDNAWNTRINAMTKLAKQVAASYPGVSVSTYPRNQVSNAGVYTATKPCLPTETATQGCGSAGAGQIWIRTIVGTQTGIHFCPAGLDSAYPYRCLPTSGTNYSSGEYRWGTAIADTAVKPPAPIRPTVRATVKAATEGQPLQFKLGLLYPYSQDLTLCYETADGTATVAAGDYTPIPTTCSTIPAWTTAGPTISVPTITDAKSELPETVILRTWGSTTPITGSVKKTIGKISSNVT